MTCRSASASVAVLVVCFALGGLLPLYPSFAQALDQLHEASDPIRFEIPAESLDAALDEYGAVSGRPVLFDSSLVAGRTSTAVHGTYAPEDALRLLLEGTGLAADYVDAGQPGAFVLKAIDRPTRAQPPAGNDGGGRLAHGRYDALMQTRIRESLCDSPLAAPGNYRTAIRFDIDPDGRIVRPRLLHSTGDRERDLAIVVILQHLRFDEPPPDDMAQPIYMVILPHSAGSEPECRAPR
ncbi:secretin and TonB N-terminal domain-containing protein [Variovorax atrisoli]|uniref:secretin and TonB N-terminal domain-containing protein n=1 Tax=Variovorax atrisoli TaxID=3394203 RepID=UPI0040400EBB